MTYGEYLAHHGILGMHWGVRRYQYEDGSLTPAGERRYDDDGPKLSRRQQRKAYIKATNRMSERMNRDVVPALQKKKLSTEEHNKRFLSEQDRIFKEEYDRVISEYRSKSSKTSQASSGGKSDEKRIRDGKIIAKAIIATSGATTIATLGSIAAYKSGKTALGNILRASASAISIGGAVGITAKVRSDRKNNRQNI